MLIYRKVRLDRPVRIMYLRREGQWGGGGERIDRNARTSGRRGTRGIYCVGGRRGGGVKVICNAISTNR